jgi:hypothetical protein
LLSVESKKRLLDSDSATVVSWGAGTIPESLIRCTNLWQLWLQNNRLAGEWHRHCWRSVSICSSCLTALRVLVCGLRRPCSRRVIQHAKYAVSRRIQLSTAERKPTELEDMGLQAVWQAIMIAAALLDLEGRLIFPLFLRTPPELRRSRCSVALTLSSRTFTPANALNKVHQNLLPCFLFLSPSLREA